MPIALWPAYVLRLAAGILAIQNPSMPVEPERAAAYAVAAAHHGFATGEETGKAFAVVQQRGQVRRVLTHVHRCRRAKPFLANQPHHRGIVGLQRIDAALHHRIAIDGEARLLNRGQTTFLTP